jgi:hypothetical protein
MNLQKRLSLIVGCDEVIRKLPEIEIHSTYKDQNHCSRRLQQRAINWDMVKLAIAYGKFEYFSHAHTWTLLDRSLTHTPYSRFVDKLRGLRIIATKNSDDSTLKLATAYWVYDLRR